MRKLVFILLLAATFGFVSTAQAFTYAGKEEVVPPATLSSKQAREIARYERIRTIRSIGWLNERMLKKRDAATEKTLEQLNAELARLNGEKSKLKDIDNGIKKSNRTVSGSMIAILVGLAATTIIIVAVVLFSLRRNKKYVDKLATDHVCHLNDVTTTLKNQLPVVEKKIDEVSGKTAALMEMSEISLTNICGRDNIVYRPPLIEGKRRSLHVPGDVKGEFPDPTSIPRVAKAKLTEMKASVAKTLALYCAKQFNPASLQARVIEHAIRSGELSGIDIIG